MSIEQIENEAMGLSHDEKARLIRKLLLSLEETSENEIAVEWLKAARQRANDLDDGSVQPVPAEEVRKKAMALLR